MEDLMEDLNGTTPGVHTSTLTHVRGLLVVVVVMRPNHEMPAPYLPDSAPLGA